MVIMIGFLLVFGTIGGIITLIAILHNLDVREILPVYRTRKKAVGAAFWGNYDETGPADSPLQTIKLPKITFEQQVLAGSEMYSKGYAVKSANAKK